MMNSALRKSDRFWALRLHVIWREIREGVHIEEINPKFTEEQEKTR